MTGYNLLAPQHSIVIPAYDEETNLPYTLTVLVRRLDELKVTYELLVVDDASRDNTGKIADEWAARLPQVRAFHHAQNQGLGGGFLTGIQNARGERFMLIPADLAMDVRDLERYFQASQRADVVVGMRSSKEDYSFVRRIISWFNITLIRTLFGMPEKQFQYISLYPMKLFREISVEYTSSAFFFAEVLIKARALGYTLTQIRVNYIPRQAGRATGANPRAVILTLRDLLLFWLRWLTLGPRRAALPASPDVPAAAPRV